MRSTITWTHASWITVEAGTSKLGSGSKSGYGRQGEIHASVLLLFLRWWSRMMGNRRHLRRMPLLRDRGITALGVLSACTASTLVGCASVPPPELSPQPGKLESPSKVHLARPGGGAHWMINVNGVDIGTLTSGTYCLFEAEDSYLSFSQDTQLSARIYWGAIGMGLLFPPLGIAVVAQTAAVHYSPVSPLVYLEAGTPQFFMLEGRGPPVALAVMSESEWTSQAHDLREVECTYSR